MILCIPFGEKKNSLEKCSKKILISDKYKSTKNFKEKLCSAEQDSAHSYCTEFLCSFLNSCVCFLWWDVVYEVCYSPAVQK